MEKKNLLSKNQVSSGKKKNISSIIFTRACCCLGIIIYHYFEHANGNYKSYFRTANSNIGLLFVTIFFCISGTVHYYNYPKINSIKRYYYKKWKSILVPYYICNIYLYILFSLVSNKIIYKGPWNKIILNLFGLDGYLRYSYNINIFNLAGIGEWFLGALIIIYALYPLLAILMNINIFIINYIICINYYLMYKTNIYSKVIYEHNIFTCINDFYFGMIAIKFKNFFFGKRIIFIFSFILLFFLFIFKISNTFFLISQIHGFSLYIFLIKIGEYFMSKRYSNFFCSIGELSYSIFLYHHWIIRDILSIYNPVNLFAHLILLSITIIIIIIFSKIHYNIVNYILKSKIFEIIDSIFLR